MLYQQKFQSSHNKKSSKLSQLRKVGSSATPVSEDIVKVQGVFVANIAACYITDAFFTVQCHRFAAFEGLDGGQKVRQCLARARRAIGEHCRVEALDDGANQVGASAIVHHLRTLILVEDAVEAVSLLLRSM